MKEKISKKQRDALEYIERKVRVFFDERKFSGHGVEHAKKVADYAYEIAQKEGCKMWICASVGWLHDIGRFIECRNNPSKKTHHELSFEILQEWFKKDNVLAGFFTKKEKEELLYAVRNHWDDDARDYKSAIILRDADKLDLLGKEGLDRHFEVHTPLDTTQRCVWFLINILRGERLKTSAAKEIALNNRLHDPFFEWIKNYLPRNKKVLCALSGGVDSAVSAYVLHRAGFEVTGVYMKNWSENSGLKGECKWQEERRDALKVAAHIGIPFITLDFEKEYRTSVVDYLFKEYKKGRTPNPDVLCNNLIKFPLLLKEAKKRNIPYVATGHYARILHEEKSKHYYLQPALDSNKDQSYFLHRLKENELAYILFPLNLIFKNEVRVIARAAGLPVASKTESMGICFIGEVPIKTFLQQKLKQKIGNIVDVSGKILGKHDGLYWFTEGQRHGFNIGGGTPYFVVSKDMKRNELIVAKKTTEDALYSKGAYIESLHWINKFKGLPFSCMIRLRHRQNLFEGIIRVLKASEKKNAPPKTTHVLIFKENQRAVTPGQFAVMYKNSVCLGGGVVAGAVPLRYTK